MNDQINAVRGGCDVKNTKWIDENPMAGSFFLNCRDSADWTALKQSLKLGTTNVVVQSLATTMCKPEHTDGGTTAPTCEVRTYVEESKTCEHVICPNTCVDSSRDFKPICTDCNNDSDCTADPAKQYCWAHTGTCKECTADEHCLQGEKCTDHSCGPERLLANIVI